MITLDIWLPQIIGYCQFIVDDSAVEKAWVKGDLSDTSISNFSELYEQIFGDLDSDNFKLESANLDKSLAQSIKNFLASLHQLDKVNLDEGFVQMQDVMASKQWLDLKSNAFKVLSNVRDIEQKKL